MSNSNPQLRNILFNTVKWASICLIIGGLIGTASAGFIVSLNWVTGVRLANIWLIYLLPLAGFVIGLLYHYYGKEIDSGNNVLIDTVHQPKKIIPFRIAIFIYLGTLTTHLFGGSAGREGTALQMASGIADQFSKPFKLTAEARQTLITAAIAGGFGSVFGTPLAGAFFALEVFLIARINTKNIIPAFATAIIADFVCRLWSAPHTHYLVKVVPPLSINNLLYVLIAGICFGLIAMTFSTSMHWLSSRFKRYIKYPPLRPVIGGTLIILLFLICKDEQFLGLGIPTIVKSFATPAILSTFALKLIFTVITLSSGYKGGEVTPLFFIGATLGSALSSFLPLPVGLLAGIGFVAVFAGATNTPVACFVMALELFGVQIWPYALLACTIAFIISGHYSIYSNALINKSKYSKYKLQLRKNVENL